MQKGVAHLKVTPFLFEQYDIIMNNIFNKDVSLTKISIYVQVYLDEKP
jgi:hypothetical protein